MAFFGELCAEDGLDLAHYSSPAFLEYSTRYHEMFLEELQKQQAEALLQSEPGQAVPAGDTISFRDTF